MTKPTAKEIMIRYEIMCIVENWSLSKGDDMPLTDDLINQIYEWYMKRIR